MTIIVVVAHTGTETLKTYCGSKAHAREVWDQYVNKGYKVSYYEYNKRKARNIV